MSDGYHLWTPCPAPVQGEPKGASPTFGSKQKQSSLFQDDQFNDNDDDNTTNNIASMLHKEFENAPPRRLQSLARKPRRGGAGLVTSVYEDGNSSLQREPHQRVTMRSSAINARPAQRIRPKTTKDDLPTGRSNDIANFKPTNVMINKHAETDRRRTIYIPEDTSILSIHPGSNQTLHDETVGLPSNPLDITPMREAPQPTPLGASAMRQVQKMASASASKRLALSPLAAVESNASYNPMGSGGGKENIPPGTVLIKLGKGEKSAKKPPIRAPLGAKQTQSSAPTQPKTTNLKKRPASELMGAPKPKVQARALHERLARNHVLPQVKPSDAFSRDFKHKPAAVLKQSTKAPVANPVKTTAPANPVNTTAAPKDLAQPDIKRSVFLAASRYPVLSDDLGQPELYEDNWLQHQEIALTQLVNVVFQQAHQTDSLSGVLATRSRMLDLYQDPSIATLHQRLKASLSCGALSMPKDATCSPKLRDDIGLRRQFFDLFGNTYHPEVLQAAAEVVVGRLITPTTNIAQSKLGASGIKEWRRFLSTFFVDHQDSTELLSARHNNPSEDAALQPGSAEWFWQKTVLRGLMLIHLLDQVKVTGKLTTCLFQTTSPHKSSASILRAFARIMLPSVGDIARPLAHLGFALHHVQNQLEECTYLIDNLAVDLRDGVLLTRFVELLLYPSATTMDDTVPLDSSAGENITNVNCRILSQHLKFPCTSKAQKMHNVQIALGALAGVRGLAGSAIENVKAEDIVNGHREKTLSLLWALVSKWGLGYLVDWDELKKETINLTKTSTYSVDTEYTMSAGLPDPNQQGPLLKEWAAAVCQQRQVVVTNLTTSFSDGRALSAIVSTYADFVPTTAKKASNKTSTADRLRTLGCSESFITLFASQATTIPSRSNTIALLAFLASRLLPLARTHRAACIIQRAYRLRLARRTMSLRVHKLRAATDCALVASNKQKQVEAAVTLQRAWRAALDRRIECLERDVSAFQCLARGWGVRRATAGILNTGAVSAGGGGRRVMGGW
jgi:abnormal spindle-like microcephaly-associated protein